MAEKNSKPRTLRGLFVVGSLLPAQSLDVSEGPAERFDLTTPHPGAPVSSVIKLSHEDSFARESTGTHKNTANADGFALPRFLKM
jgi:hypothetical protein